LKRYITFIGDIHGCYKTFKALLGKIPQHDNRILLMGDIINKGKRSFEVYDYVRRNKLEMLLGNHDFFCVHRNSKAYAHEWQRLGGNETVQSIKQLFPSASDVTIQVVLTEMGHYFSKRPLFMKVPTQWGKTLLATHGGISTKVYQRFNKQLGDALRMKVSDAHSYLFNKGDLAEIPGYIQVIGHQPIPYDQLQTGSNYRIDTGCVYTRPGMGWLTALTFDLVAPNPPEVFRQINLDY